MPSFSGVGPAGARALDVHRSRVAAWACRFEGGARAGYLQLHSWSAERFTRRHAGRRRASRPAAPSSAATVATSRFRSPPRDDGVVAESGRVRIPPSTFRVGRAQEAPALRQGNRWLAAKACARFPALLFCTRRALFGAPMPVLGVNRATVGSDCDGDGLVDPHDLTRGHPRTLTETVCRTTARRGSGSSRGVERRSRHDGRDSARRLLAATCCSAATHAPRCRARGRTSHGLGGAPVQIRLPLAPV